MNKHTPGPWHVSSDRDHVVIKAGNFDYLPAQTKGATLEEWQANAALIAAAPDLLHALEMVRDANRSDPHIPPTALAVIEAAIAKAEGGKA